MNIDKLTLNISTSLNFKYIFQKFPEIKNGYESWISKINEDNFIFFKIFSLKYNEINSNIIYTNKLTNQKSEFYPSFENNGFLIFIGLEKENNEYFYKFIDFQNFFILLVNKYSLNNFKKSILIDIPKNDEIECKIQKQIENISCDNKNKIFFPKWYVTTN